MKRLKDWLAGSTAALTASMLMGVGMLAVPNVSESHPHGTTRIVVYAYHPYNCQGHTHRISFWVSAPVPPLPAVHEQSLKAQGFDSYDFGGGTCYNI